MERPKMNGITMREYRLLRSLFVSYGSPLDGLKVTTSYEGDSDESRNDISELVCTF